MASWKTDSALLKDKVPCVYTSMWRRLSHNQIPVHIAHQCFPREKLRAGLAVTKRRKLHIHLVIVYTERDSVCMLIDNNTFLELHMMRECILTLSCSLL